MSYSYGSFPINLAKGIMANFGRIELLSDKIVILDPSVNTFQDGSSPKVEILLSNITLIRQKTWLYFNSRIFIEYQENNQSKTIDFASGDTWSTNMFKTIYLYQALLELKSTGSCNVEKLSKTAYEDKISVFLMFVGCIVGLYILTSLLGFYGKEFSIIYMFIGSAIFGIPACYLYLIKARRLIKMVDNNNRY